jgi:hypothetical protein
MRFLVILLIIRASQCWASYGLDECVKEHNTEKKKLCIAVATSNANDCDKIQNLDLKITCIKEVRDINREANWKIQPLNNKTTTLR